ncbi:hypothetical protein EOD42_14380 [Rhodovarius crocodyli]|uniref:Uncharacterized protein n=1 Tax=Rhodovarius crocodyli TaxID=1979269 RepID=A0A437MF56_9PROT|nr:hypothetical protein [Rhodovarius crocodyli]RVT96294.1 hypothetical protein EOD42_14380 [Rhodovarius crocodyli]
MRRNTPTVSALLKQLEDEALARGLSRAELAAQANLHVNTLRGFGQQNEPRRGAGRTRVREHHWNPTLSTILAIESVLVRKVVPSSKPVVKA